MLGIPTANLDAEALGGLADQAAGIYLGWASLGGSADVHAMVMSVGWNPFFGDADKKTVEPWLLADFPGDFYGEELRLVAAGYLRPEADFVSVEALVDRIHNDAAAARASLALPPYAALRDDPFLAPP